MSKTWTDTSPERMANKHMKRNSLSSSTKKCRVKSQWDLAAHRLERPISFLGLQNKLPQTWQLRTADWLSHSSWDQKSTHQGYHAPSKGSKKESFLASFIFFFLRKWQPTSVFLPGEFPGERSLTGYNPWGHKESDTTEQLSLTF